MIKNTVIWLTSTRACLYWTCRSNTNDVTVSTNSSAFFFVFVVYMEMITAWFSNICIFRSPKRGYHVNEWPKRYAILKRCCVNTLLNSNEIKSTQVHWKFMLLPIFLQNSKKLHANCYSFQLKWIPEAGNLRTNLFLFTQSKIYRDRLHFFTIDLTHFSKFRSLFSKQLTRWSEHFVKHFIQIMHIFFSKHCAQNPQMFS